MTGTATREFSIECVGEERIAFGGTWFYPCCPCREARFRLEATTQWTELSLEHADEFKQIEPGMPSAREQLLRLLVERSYRWDPINKFKLTSGKLSDYYLECKLTTFHAPALPLVGEVLYDIVRGRAVAVGGLTQGADPLALAVAFYSASQGDPMHAFSVRKEPKQHGAHRWIEGCAQRGDPVFVFDDVVTSGGSTLKAMRACREGELDVRGVVALVDREEDNGLANIQAELGSPLPVLAVFTRTEIEQYRRDILGG